jgi:hypothetical protein
MPSYWPSRIFRAVSQQTDSKTQLKCTTTLNGTAEYYWLLVRRIKQSAQTMYGI